MRSSIQSAKTRLEADYGSDHEHLIAKFRLKLKKVGKTNRPFRYDLNPITYYTVEINYTSVKFSKAYYCSHHFVIKRLILVKYF